jgi:hypothetical protein
MQRKWDLVKILVTSLAKKEEPLLRVRARGRCPAPCGFRHYEMEHEIRGRILPVAPFASPGEEDLELPLFLLGNSENTHG